MNDESTPQNTGLLLHKMTREEIQDAYKDLALRYAALQKSGEYPVGTTAERVLRDDAKYRMAFEYTGTAMLVVNEDMTFAMANHRMEEITGYSMEELAKGNTFLDYVVDGDHEKMLEYHRKRRMDPALAPQSYEFRVKHKSGAIVDVWANVSMVPDTNQSLVSLIDVTEKKEFERALQESEKRHKDLYENANDIIYIHDSEGKFISVNKAALTTYGYTEQEVTELNIRDIIDPACLDKAFERFRSNDATRDAGTSFELLTYTRDRRPVWVDVKIRLITEGDGVIAVQGIARDITERKKALEQLEESQKRFRETAELLPSVICEVNLDLKLQYVNKVGLDIFGYTEEDHPETVTITELVFPADRPKVAENVRQILSGTIIGPQEYRMVHKDGSVGYYLASSTPMYNNGSVCGLRTSLLNITERIETQKKLSASEKKFRSIYSKSPMGIALFNRAGECVEWNTAFGNLFHLGPRAHREPQALRMESIVPLTEEQRGGLLSGKSVQCDVPFTIESLLHVIDSVKKDAGPQFLNIHITPLSGTDDSHADELLMEVHDITARKKAEESKIKEARDATQEANRKIESLKNEMMDTFTFNNMVSRSPQMRKIFDILPQIADAATTVLVRGESGTGKELIAQSIHDLGHRKGKPFVAINCGALPDTLLESELFGYKAGAFTDAKKDKPGKFALAEGGTLFLDEIGDISPAMQVKLLRVLQERIYEPLGGTQPIAADVRVIAATNKDLVEMVREGTFREDLYYRINVLQIQLPALRKRRCDIPILCEHMILRFNARFGKQIKTITQSALDMLLAYDYPGNIRELENTIEHAFIFCKNSAIEPHHLPGQFQQGNDTKSPAIVSQVNSLDELERLYIENVLEECDNNKVLTAKKLGIHKATLFRKIKKLGIGDS